MSGAARPPLEAAPPSEHPRGPLWHWELWTSTWPWARGRNQKIPSNHPTLISPYFIENKLLHKSLDRNQNDMFISTQVISTISYQFLPYLFSKSHQQKQFHETLWSQVQIRPPWCWRSRFPNIARPFVGGGGVRASRKWLQGVFVWFLVCFMIWKEIQSIMVIGEIPKYP